MSNHEFTFEGETPDIYELCPDSSERADNKPKRWISSKRLSQLATLSGLVMATSGLVQMGTARWNGFNIAYNSDIPFKDGQTILVDSTANIAEAQTLQTEAIKEQYERQGVNALEKEGIRDLFAGISLAGLGVMFMFKNSKEE